MKNTIALAFMVGLAATAAAQPADPKKTPPPAGDKTAPPPGQAKKEPAPPAATPAPAPAPMPELKPPPELAAMAKAGAGNWKCSGKMSMGPAASMTEVKGTFKQVLDPTKFWIKADWALTGSKIKGSMWTTYDATSKKWYRHAMNNMGGGSMSWSAGLPAGATEGKVVWEGEHHGMGMQHKTRMTEEVAAKSVKITSEASMDGGKTWKTAMEMTCTK